MQISYIGNFEPAHSTENHVARALEHNGHTVIRHQESDPAVWFHAHWLDEGSDFVLWTRTGWDWNHTAQGGEAAIRADQYRRLLQARNRKLPVIGYHLDIWWGLRREGDIHIDAFFQVDLLVTADGGHDEHWKLAKVNHVWFPPAVSLAETEPGMFRSDLASPIAFVGSHNGDYHPESKHRHELVRWLKENYTRDCAFWPRPGEHALRGTDLRDLYASVEVLVGDSCFAGTGLPRYWSDRVPETLGRGGFLIHPYVPGLEHHFDLMDLCVAQPAVDGIGAWEHMAVHEPFQWEHLRDTIEWALSHPEERKAIAQTGRQHVIKNHTYERRMEQLIELLYERKLLKRPRKK